MSKRVSALRCKCESGRRLEHAETVLLQANRRESLDCCARPLRVLQGV